MSKTTCTRRLTFCAGHRVLGHEGKCKNLHGHNYVAHFTAQADGLDPLGRVVDFSVLKHKIGTFLDERFDHKVLANCFDADLIRACEDYHWPLYVMPNNPTAENIAEHLLRNICPRLLKDTGVIITKIVLEETENCSAEVTL